MKRIISAFVLLIILVCSLASCNNSSNNTSNNNTNAQLPISAYENLNVIEKRLFDELIDSVNIFYNPSDVRIVSIADATLYASNSPVIQYTGEYTFILKLKSTNQLGGAITRWYKLENDVLKVSNADYSVVEVGWVNFYDFSNMGEELPVSCAKINAALNEHWGF